ncbi:YihD family protein [Endozoicomonas gorgoniicola]|uniref:YihD family protein n=1 Tax=Endozoicomonas gorgoniicola TaxID=1234144 RepID=A0ABT3MPZ6_9GAMM|nr:YihD family protein [Endozoicomonas gorgoniicola]MCW7551437.1 YihD family protein [Endozoicomonas gorgoniicola]
MQCHRINELLDLLKDEWMTSQNDSLMSFLGKIAEEAGHKGDLRAMNDDMLIYHLKMRSRDHHEMIPGIAKDCIDDFKTAILKARGIS